MGITAAAHGARTMMATPHMLAGAALGRALHRPWLAYPAALTSHYLLDIVPHLDPHRLWGVQHGGPTRPEVIAGVCDLALGALLVGLMARGQRVRRIMAVGALLAVLVDLVEYLPVLGPRLAQVPSLRFVVLFHHGIQHNVALAQWPLGFGTQLVVVGLAVAACLRRRDGRVSAGAARARGDARPIKPPKEG